MPIYELYKKKKKSQLSGLAFYMWLALCVFFPHFLVISCNITLHTFSLFFIYRKLPLRKTLMHHQPPNNCFTNNANVQIMNS